MTEITPRKIPLTTRLAIYGSGLFADGATNVVIPLWALYLQPSPLAFGLVIGARSMLPFLFGIHGGALMDRLGARQVMLFFAVIGLVVPILFPLLPWIWVAGILNLIIGLSSTMNWVGAQTLVGQMVRKDASLTWHMTFCNRLGHLSCPMLAGAMWDLFGPWGGFGVTFTWAVLFMGAAVMLPRGNAEARTAEEPSRGGLSLRDLAPRLEDYVGALKLLGIPLVAVVATGSALNIATGAIQGSFYIAYIKEIGLSNTLIGVIFAAGNLFGLIGTASVGRLTRRIGDVWLMNFTVVAAIAAITITPLLGVFVLLLVVAVFRGFMTGTGQPLMIVIPAKSVPPGSQGSAVGLRISINRFVQSVLPPIMGGIAGLVGLEPSFWIVGGCLFVLSTGLWVTFRPPHRTPAEPSA